MSKEISVCIPCLEEGDQLDDLFESLHDSDLRDLSYEILLCDSNSQDNTVEIYQKWKSILEIKLVITNKANASENLNAGLRCASGEVYCRVDARGRVSKNYFSTGLDILKNCEETVCAVGPLVSVIPQSDGYFSKYISFFFLSPFFMGPSKYKNSFFNRNFEGTVDSIYLGFFKTEDLLSIGGFNHELERKQDIDLFRRLKELTGKNLFISNSLKAQYILKHDTVYGITKRSYIQGTYAGSDIGNIRIAHIIPFLALVFFLLISILSFRVGLTIFLFYALLSAFFGFYEKRNFLSLPLAIVIFSLVHSSYTLGNMIGLVGSFSATTKRDS